MRMGHELVQKLLMTMMDAIKHPDGDNTWSHKGVGREPAELVHVKPRPIEKLCVDAIG
jgi:hypothetical protein